MYISKNQIVYKHFFWCVDIDLFSKRFIMTDDTLLAVVITLLIVVTIFDLLELQTL